MYCFFYFPQNSIQRGAKVEAKTNAELEEIMKSKFHNSTDLKVRNIISYKNKPTILFFIDNIVDIKRIDRNVIENLQREVLSLQGEETYAENASKNIITIGQNQIVTDLEEVEAMLLNGFCAIYFENSTDILLVDVKNFQSRSIAEPPTSAVLKGPREGFNESIATNIMLLRKRLKHNDFVVNQFAVGKYSQTQVAVVYIDSIADSSVVQKVLDKIKNIDIDGIVDAFYLQKALEERAYSLFQQVGSSEKPDVVMAKLLEGRVAIIADGSPIVLTVPYILIEDLQSSNDYYSARSTRVTFLRFLRLLGMLIAIYLPGIYVALQVFHYKVIPLKFLVTITNSTLGIPFTPLIEILFIILLFEGLTEASLRMPSYLGLALSVVGALILGDTAVSAGLVSPPAVMIVALTGVLLFTVPDQEAQISVLRLIFTIIGGVLGLYGMIAGTVFLFAYLSNIDSYGAPYLAPYAPNVKSDKKDGFRRQDLRGMRERPKSIPNKNPTRLKKL